MMALPIIDSMMKSNHHQQHPFHGSIDIWIPLLQRMGGAEEAQGRISSLDVVAAKRSNFF
jgi:hypothetical protein